MNRAAPIVALAALLLTAGCTASPPDEPSPSPSAEAVPPEDTCAELSDVGTLVFNWSSAAADGRLVGHEYNGGMRLAARMLDRIEAGPGTELADVVKALQDAAPATAAGMQGDGVRPESDSWRDAWSRVGEACNSALGAADPISGFGVEGWVGG